MTPFASQRCPGVRCWQVCFWFSWVLCSTRKHLPFYGKEKLLRLKYKRKLTSSLNKQNSRIQIDFTRSPSFCLRQIIIIIIRKVGCSIHANVMMCSLPMTRAITAQCKKESHWRCLIDLKGDKNFTLQNQLALKGQKLGLCLQSLIFLSPHRFSPFSRRVIFMGAHISLALLFLRENGGLLTV